MPELVDFVNENDVVIGNGVREDHGKLGVIMRNVVVFIQDPSGNHLLQVRSLEKKRYPGSYDFAACGSVKKDESYESAANRELHEELGVLCPLRLLCKRYREVFADGKIGRYFTAFFHGVYDGEPRLTSEVERFFRMSTVELDKMIANKDAGVEEYLIHEWQIAKEFFQ